jgi:hypothetical protein
METCLYKTCLLLILNWIFYVEFVEYFSVILTAYNFFVPIYSLSFILASYTISWLLVLPCSLGLFGRLEWRSWLCHNILWSHLSAYNSLSSILSDISLIISLIFKNYSIIIIAYWWLRQCLAISSMMISPYRLIKSSCILIKSWVV